MEIEPPRFGGKTREFSQHGGLNPRGCGAHWDSPRIPGGRTWSRRSVARRQRRKARASKASAGWSRSWRWKRLLELQGGGPYFWQAVWVARHICPQSPYLSMNLFFHAFLANMGMSPALGFSLATRGSGATLELWELFPGARAQSSALRAAALPFTGFLGHVRRGNQWRDALGWDAQVRTRASFSLFHRILHSRPCLRPHTHLWILVVHLQAGFGGRFIKRDLEWECPQLR